PEFFEARRSDAHRVDGGADVVEEARQCELLRAGASTVVAVPSYTVTAWPVRASTTAALSPLGPLPVTVAFMGCAPTLRILQIFGARQWRNPDTQSRKAWLQSNQCIAKMDFSPQCVRNTNRATAPSEGTRADCR